MASITWCDNGEVGAEFKDLRKRKSKKKKSSRKTK